jgi:hypothetical protein
MFNEKTYKDFYLRSKITVDELKQFPGFESRTEEELIKICDDLFDLGILYQRIYLETNEKFE